MTQKQEQPEIQFDEYYARFLSKRKVHQREYFISVGPGPQEDRYYACIMRPATDEEILNGSDEFIIFGKENNKCGHRTADDAKKAAAQRYPTLPVLVVGDTYFYPCYESYARKLRVLHEAEKKRQRKKRRRLGQQALKSGMIAICDVCSTKIKIEGPIKEGVDLMDVAVLCEPCGERIEKVMGGLHE